MYCNALVIAANITYWISHNYNRTPLATHKTDRLFPQIKQRSYSQHPKTNRLFPTSNSDRPSPPAKTDRLSINKNYQILGCKF
ncbi:hypothetical protein [Pseudanabaena sp. 'Roaring Creek']|uniref:hypothetical protein n=1 Tax=Pseudanabaena sp. 'Roaring Creek' TaxID=1681830 RepID=UPI0012E127C2|nr:hypothetical protein [Pseudanabaena sp. 'Roaring Creek']